MKLKGIFFVVGLLLILSLALGACQAAPGGETGGEEKEMITFSDQQWQTLWLNNAIARYIIENGYGYPTEEVEVTTPIAWQSMEDGEIDVMMELWRMNTVDVYNRLTEEGIMLDLGPIFDRSAQGFYVPRYVIEGDSERGLEPLAPDLVSVFDLPQYIDIFSDPENRDKGLIVNCITGWECAEVNRVKIHAYELDDDYNLLTPGSTAALDAAIAGANEKGEPIVSYYWEPTWLLGKYDMVLLEEPEYTDECWDKQQSAVGDDAEVELDDVDESFGCSYEFVAIHTGVNANLQERAPEVVEFLDNMNVGNDPLQQTAAFMTDAEVDETEGAIYYLRNFEDRWRGWVPEDVAQKVADALAEEEITE